MSRKLIAYFSPGIGETAETAKNLAEILRADLYEIKALEPYTKEDLDWEHPYSRNVLEKQDKYCRPAIAGDLLDLTDYDTVFLGFPIWWNTAPKIILTFAESLDFEGKTVVPFATSKGSGMGSSSQDIREAIIGNAVVTEGMLLNGYISPFKIKNWLNSLGIE